MPSVGVTVARLIPGALAGPVAAVAIAATWWVVLSRTNAPDMVGRTLEFGAPLAATLAIAAALGGVGEPGRARVPRGGPRPAG